MLVNANRVNPNWSVDVEPGKRAQSTMEIVLDRKWQSIAHDGAVFCVLGSPSISIRSSKRIIQSVRKCCIWPGCSSSCGSSLQSIMEDSLPMRVGEYIAIPLNWHDLYRLRRSDSRSAFYCGHSTRLGLSWSSCHRSLNPLPDDLLSIQSH
jgi:hypothetical protein